MDGITILNTIIVNDCADWVSFIALTLGVICIVAFILTLTSNDNRVIIFGIISLLALIAMQIIIITNKNKWRNN